MASHHHNVKSPGYYIRRRLLKNKPAMFGFTVIVIAHLVTLLGYLIMPDQTPSANHGAVQIQRQSPGFTVTMLRTRKNRHVPQVNVFEKMLYGQEPRYNLVPVDTFYIDGFTVTADIFGDRIKSVKQLDLVDAVKPVFVGASDKMEGKYEVDGNMIRYLGLDEKIHTITKKALVKEFRKKCVVEKTYLLGTDSSGRDVLSRLLFGTRISLSIGFLSVLISLVVGISLGAFSGFFGGATDNFIMWLMTVVWSIPSIMLVIAISMAIQSKGIWVAFVAVGLTMWVDVARVVRGQITSLKEEQFVEAARALGVSNMRIIFYHIMPNLMGPIIVIATANFAAAILIEAGLSFLGLGVQPPMPSWGMMVNAGYESMGAQNSWHLVVFPSISISLMVLAFNLFGNGLRDAYDPKGTKGL